MSTLGSMMAGAMSAVSAQLGTNAKLFRGAVDTFGPEKQVPYSTSGGDVVVGTWGPVEEQSEVAQATSELHGSSYIGTKPVRRTFTFDAAQIAYAPSVDDHLVEPSDKNWQVTRALQIQAASRPIQWMITVEEIWPLPF
ncbi:MAG TPA: hypothetical protein VFC63_09810 [Blastocatellia bacterium]|nr:hypothetical protein [Blastocatellia bacterium]